jgi:3-deoxy-manno-octulosonate cytidylyltransferase (CMP-KDO synthetase)
MIGIFRMGGKMHKETFSAAASSIKEQTARPMTYSRSKDYSCVAIIPARYGSTRFPAKLLVPILGKSLIQRTYENACRCEALDNIVVATDDVRLFEHVRTFGGRAIMTSPTCYNGTERVAEAYRHYYLANEHRVEIVVNLQGDEPCVEPSAIEAIVEALRADPSAAMSTAITPIRSMSEALNSSVVKCVTDLNGHAIYFSRSLIPGNKNSKYDPTVPCYRHIGIYGFRPDFLSTYVKLPSTPLQQAEDLEQLKVLEHGYRIKTALVNSFSIGVDTPEDIGRLEEALQAHQPAQFI